VQVLEAAPNPCQVSSGWFLRFILTVILKYSKHPILDIICMYVAKWFSIFLGKLNLKTALLILSCKNLMGLSK
jgi:hypothetical protein